MTTIQLPEATLDVLDLADGDAYDFYREVHKGLRHALFQATVAAGNLDVADDTEVESHLELVRNLLHLLHAHHEHEDKFIQPLIEAHAPQLGLDVLGQHGHVEIGMARLDLLVDRLGMVARPGRAGAALNLHLDLSRLTSEYLAHQLVEETKVMPALRAVVPTDELLALDMEIRLTIAPQEMVGFMAHMLPAMNVQERVDMLTGMSAAPPEVFDVFRTAAQVILPSDEWAPIARQLGLSR
jgi:hypothetical protein